MFVNREVPDAYFLTWTCYGTWLPGDERGSVNDNHNLYGHDPAPHDPARVAGAVKVMRCPPFHIDPARRALIETAICDHCRIRRWRLRALNVRTTHVHVVASIGAADPDVAMEQFKYWCTRRLRESGLVAPGRTIWTRRGSTGYCWTEDDVANAVNYVNNRQGSDLPGHIREWRSKALPPDRQRGASEP